RPPRRPRAPAPRPMSFCLCFDPRPLPGLDDAQSCALRALRTPGMKGRGMDAWRDALREHVPNAAVQTRLLDELKALGLVRRSRFRIVPTDRGRALLTNDTLR